MEETSRERSDHNRSPCLSSQLNSCAILLGNGQTTSKSKAYHPTIATAGPTSTFPRLAPSFETGISSWYSSYWPEMIEFQKQRYHQESVVHQLQPCIPKEGLCDSRMELLSLGTSSFLLLALVFTCNCSDN